MSKQKGSTQKDFVYKKHPNHKKITIRRIIGWFLLMTFLSMAIFLIEQNVNTFQASLIPTKHAPSFDGLVMPVQKVPDWVKLSDNEWNLNYSDMPSNKMVQIPEYNPQKLKIPFEELKWGNAKDNAIRNEKITYSVPYMGNYKLDGIEFAGSHLAVDIKIPSGTPIYAIGNGIIKKTSEQLYGFGKHVVIEHIDFPSYENSSVKTTYYSSYSHLQSINVTEGSVVKKSDIIGYSGSTGTTTTPHLHFQIDKNTAPWYPFWPFTSKESADAGLSFNGAVNAGLNQEKAIMHTISPIMYIQKHTGAQSNYATPRASQPQSDQPQPHANEPQQDQQTTSPSSTTRPVNKETPARVPEKVVDENDNIQENYYPKPLPLDLDIDNDKTTTVEHQESTYITYEIVGDDTFIPNQPKTIAIKAVTRDGSTVSNYSPDEQIKIDVTRGQATIKPNRLNSSDFINGIAKLTFTTKNESPVEFMIKTNTLRKESSTIYPGLFADINSAHPHFKAISFLKDEGVIQGYPDGSFKPDNRVSRVEVIKFILEGIKADVKNTNSLPFSDTDSNQWYSKYLHTAHELGIVDGYPDGTFKPGNSVNKVEFLKMLIEAMQIDISENVEDLGFTDVSENQWYAPYIQFAIEKNIIEIEGNKFKPTSVMKRDEIAEAIYRVKMLMMTGSNNFSSNLKPA